MPGCFFLSDMEGGFCLRARKETSKPWATYRFFEVHTKTFARSVQQYSFGKITARVRFERCDKCAPGEAKPTHPHYTHVQLDKLPKLFPVDLLRAPGDDDATSLCRLNPRMCMRCKVRARKDCNIRAAERADGTGATSSDHGGDARRRKIN